MDTPPTPPASRGSGRALGRLCVGVLAALGAVSALWAVVLLPPLDPVANPTLLPRVAASLLLAGPGLYYMTLYAGRAAGSRLGAIMPAAAWVTAVLVISAGRPEGDSAYLLSSYQGLLLAPLGISAAAMGVARAGRVAWPQTGRRQAFPGSADS
jgi:hypothetical protein